MLDFIQERQRWLVFIFLAYFTLYNRLQFLASTNKNKWKKKRKTKVKSINHALPLWTLKADKTYEVTVFRYSTTGNMKHGQKKNMWGEPPLPFLPVLNPSRDRETRSGTQAEHLTETTTRPCFKSQPIHKRIIFLTPSGIHKRPQKIIHE